MREEKDQAYEAYSEFDRIKRKKDAFPRRENKNKNTIRLASSMSFCPMQFWAFKLLDTPGLDIKDKQLALTACLKPALKLSSRHARGPVAGNNLLDNSGEAQSA